MLTWSALRRRSLAVLLVSCTMVAPSSTRATTDYPPQWTFNLVGVEIVSGTAGDLDTEQETWALRRYGYLRGNSEAITFDCPGFDLQAEKR